MALMTPKNITTTELLTLMTASRSSAVKPLFIQVYDFTARKWMQTTDAGIIDAATKAAAPNMTVDMTSGDRLFIGDLNNQRVLVEVW